MDANRLVRQPRIGEDLLEAVLKPDLWIQGLERIAQATGSTRAQLIGVDCQGALAFNYMTSIDEAFISDFLKLDGHHQAAENFRIAAAVGAPLGEIVSEERYGASRLRTGETAYADLCEKHGIPFGCQTSLIKDDNMHVGLAILRTRAEGPTTAADRLLFAQAIGPVHAALQFQRMVGSHGAELVKGSLDLLETPALLSDAFGQIVAVTGAADTVLSRHPAIDLHDRRLVGATPSDTGLINHSLRSVLDRNPVHLSLRLGDRHIAPLIVRMQAMPLTELGFGFEPRAIITLHDDATPSQRAALLLRHRYNLSPAEGEIVALLVRGTRRIEIADIRGTSLGTVQQQIKSIFQKTGISRETDLLSLIMHLQDFPPTSK